MMMYFGVVRRTAASTAGAVPARRRRVARLAAALLGFVTALLPIAAIPPLRPTIAYTVRIDPDRVDVIDVAIAVRGVEASLPLAMKVHAEYDARYWRFFDGVSADGADGRPGNVSREGNTLWRVTMPGGAGFIRYRVHVQPTAPGLRRAWQTFARADGALLNPPDVFLYLPTHADVPATVTLDVPRAWRVATALDRTRAPATYQAADAVALLDAPILLGTFRHWRFAQRGTTYHAVYWPLADAAPFDTVALVDELRRLAAAALDIFGQAPSHAYWFLLQDGASDALEHRSSVTIGVPSARLARDPHAFVEEIAHEFFHAWNLVAIHPAGYNDLGFGPPARSSLLWLGEGVTLHYADILPRRARLAPTVHSRLDHLAALLEHYYASPALRRVSPARASLAFDDSPVANGDATGGYYLQGELLANALDARLRVATHDRRGLDDLMRALYAASQSPQYHGYTEADVIHSADAVCDCRLDGFFANEVRGAGPIDPTPILARLGLRLVVDSIPASDSAGRLLPDARVGIDFTAPPGVLRLVVTDSTSAFARAGVRTGDELLSVNGTAVSTFAGLRAATSRISVGDTAALQLRRGDRVLDLAVPLAAYRRPRVRFVDAAVVSATERRRRAAWLNGG